ncbi:MAG: glycosyltransferase [Rhodospirillaceae bacterium]|nr:glycosyltransferase [Rhodospirillaceae bacterium]
MAGAAHGGAETFFVDLACAFARAGVAQHVVTRPAPGRLDSLSAAGIAVSTARFGGILDLATRRTIGRAIADFQPDVVLAWMNRAAAAVPRPRAGDRHVTVGRLGGYYDLKYYRTCQALIGNTADICAHIRNAGRDPALVFHVPNFCPVEPGAAPDRAPVRASGAAAPSARVLLILARLETVKGIDVALRALAQVKDAELWIAGEGGERAVLERLAGDLGVRPRVRFLGWRDDRAALLRAADIVLVPSRHEPFGNVVVNAWAYGRPLIAARAQGPAALVRDGIDGLLVDVDDADGLARAIADLSADPARAAALAAAGLARAAAEFSETAVVEGYLSAFRAVRARIGGDLPTPAGGA